MQSTYRRVSSARFHCGLRQKPGKLASPSPRADIMWRKWATSRYCKSVTMRRLQTTIFTGLSILLAVTNPLHASAGEVGVSSDTILFGQAAALEGPSSALGRGMRQGILAAFAEINAKGGVHGRKLELISRDDGYDPDRSAAQTTKLIEEDKVFALIGAVGTATATVTVPIAKAGNVPFIGPFTGAGFCARRISTTSSIF